MKVCSVPVEFFGIDGDGPGLAGLVKVFLERVAYTVSETVSTRKPSLPLPSAVCVNVALGDIWYILSNRVPYVRIPTIGVKRGYVK